MTNRVDELVGHRVRVRREMLQLSQADLARRLGLSERQVSRCELGVERISASLLMRLCRALEVSITFFFEDLVRPTKPH